MSKVRRDPENPKNWMIDASVRLPNGKWAHLEKKGYRTRADAEGDVPKQASLFRKRSGFKASEGSFETLCESFLGHMRDRRKPTTFHDMERDVRSCIEDPLRGHVHR
jgi:hypothetical protein